MMMTLKDEILALGMSLDDHGAIANVLSVGRKKVLEKFVTERTVWSVLGAVQGQEFLNKFEDLSNEVLADGHPLIPYQPVFRKCVGWLAKDGIDFGNSEIRNMVRTTFVAVGLLTPEQAQALLAVAEVDDVITSQEVTKALEGV